MKTVNIQEAKEDLAQLLEKAADGEPFIVTQEGKPSLKVVMVEEVKPSVNDVAVASKKPRVGFLKGKISVPGNFDRMFSNEIEEMFYGEHK